MSSKFLIIALIAVVGLVSTVGIVMPSSIPIFPQRIADEDMAEIIKLTLERAVVAKEIPDYNLIKDKENIVLCTENIDPNLVPKIPRVNLILLEPDKIQEKADREGDFLYLHFKQLKIEDSKVIVSLDNVWAKSKYIRFMYLSGGGFIIEYHKEFVRWVGKVISGWIS